MFAGTSVNEGDSGSGFTVTNNKGQYIIYGIVSVKEQNMNKLAAFTNVLSHLKFIDNIRQSLEAIYEAPPLILISL